MVNIVALDREQAKGLFEPQRKNNWIIQFHLPDARGVRDIQVAAQTVTLPQQEIAEVELDGLNYSTKVAGKVKFANIDFEFKDYLDTQATNAMLAWHYMVANPATGVVGLAKQYKKDADIILFAPNGSMERRWKLQGCWLPKFDPGALDRGSGDKNMCKGTVCYDRAVPTFVAANLSQIAARAALGVLGF
jgi:hypothetical protein